MEIAALNTMRSLKIVKYWIPNKKNSFVKCFLGKRK